MLSVCLSGVLTLVQKLPIVSLSCSSTLRHHFMSCPSNSPVSFFPTASSSTFPTLTRPTPLACPQSLSNHSTFCPSPTLQQLSRPNYIRSRRVKETELCDWGGRGHDGLFEIFVASEPDVGVINKLRVLGRRPHRNVLPSTIRSRADLVPLPPRFVTGQLCTILAVHLASRRDTSLPG